MVDSQFPQNIQNKDPFFLFQVPPQQYEEPIDLKNNIEVMIQCQNDFNQSINMAELDQLCNPINDSNEKLYLTHF